MTEPVTMAESDADFQEVFAALLEERDLDGGRATVTQLSIARKAARALVDDAADPKDVSALLALLGPVVKRAAREPTLAEMDDAPIDLDRLDSNQLAELAMLLSIARGASCAVPDRRRAAALNLVRLVSGDRDPEALPACQAGSVEGAIRLHVRDILAPEFMPEQLYRYLEGGDRTDEIVELKARIKQLEAALHHERLRSSGKLVSLAERRAQEAEAANLIS